MNKYIMGRYWFERVGMDERGYACTITVKKNEVVKKRKKNLGRSIKIYNDLVSWVDHQ